MDPVLLLDDIFDKLDDNRVSYILELIRSKKIGQCFITDTSTTKIPNILSDFKVDYNLFEIENGAVKNKFEKRSSKEEKLGDVLQKFIHSSNLSRPFLNHQIQIQFEELWDLF